MVNNAGINRVNKFCEIPDVDIDEILQVNLVAPIKIMRHVLPHMISQSWGRIVNLGSIFSKVSKEYRAVYSASKFGIDGITASASAEFSRQGVLVNTISPGFIATELTEKVLGEAGMKSIVNTVPIGRLGQANEVAELVGWLVSSKNTFVTGQNVLIDGGFTRV